MKYARFVVHGHYHEGTLTATGMLRDEAGHEHRQDDVVFLPPVEPHAITSSEWSSRRRLAFRSGVTCTITFGTTKT